MWCKNIAGRFFGLVTEHACDRRTDGQTDRQSYDSQDRAGIAASRGNEGFAVKFGSTCIELMVTLTLYIKYAY